MSRRSIFPSSSTSSDVDIDLTSLQPPTLSFLLHPNGVIGGRSRTFSPARLSALSAKKKKANPNASSTKTMQVLLLQTIPGTGVQNEVVMLSPAYWSNVVQKKGLGRLVTDEEVQSLDAGKQQKATESKQAATEFCKKVTTMSVLCVTRKEGEGGKLFGKVSAKDVIASLKDALGEAEFKVEEKKVKVEIEGKGKNDSIKTTGEFECKAGVAGFDDVGKFTLKVVGGEECET